MSRKPAPCGSWPSPITTDLVSGHALRLSACKLGVGDGDRGAIYWIEGRPAEGGRNVLVRRAPDGNVVDVSPPPLNVRTRVHEYGGGAFTVGSGRIFVVDFSSQRIFQKTHPTHGNQQAGSTAFTPLTRENDIWRFADLVCDEQHNRLLAIGERHDGKTEQPTNHIVAISLENGPGNGRMDVLLSGADFYSNPRPSPDGGKIAFLSWDHPNMPWDAAALSVAHMDDDGRISTPTHIAGGMGTSVFQPGWSPAGDLIFVDEPDGYWNLFFSSQGTAPPRALVPMDAEFGMPLWQLGASAWAFLDGNRLAAAYVRAGQWSLGIVDPAVGGIEPIATGLTAISHLDAAAGTIAVIGGSATMPSSVVRIDVSSTRAETVRASLDLTSTPALTDCFSRPEPIHFNTTDGDIAHAFFFPPTHPSFDVPTNEKPPLLVVAHGGPTSATSGALNPLIQFWTSRGFAVADVDYRGSTGYGRPYRERLAGNWGIRDVEDCVAVARHLAAEGQVDGRRMAIRGGSAGGFTALAALTFHDVFSAGASHYGVTDLAGLAVHTHKFELRYLDGLIGPYPQDAEIYRARSPLYAADRLQKPVIFFQGLEDKVVPPEQAEAMVAALRENGVPVAYLSFAGEQHGFRRSETIRRVLEAELYFYSRIFGFSPADITAPVPIENL